MIVLNMPQRSEEWHKARAGTITASAVENIMSPGMRSTYVNKMLAEMLTGEPSPFIVSAEARESIQRGIDFEDQARERYIKETGDKVTEVGFIYSDETRRVGCSPDGLVDDDGLIEIKCPNSATHIGYLRSGEAPKKYFLQMQHQMYVTGRAWCDFVSWDDRFKDEKSQILIVRVYRCSDTINKIAASVKATINDIDKFLADNNIKWERPE